MQSAAQRQPIIHAEINIKIAVKAHASVWSVQNMCHTTIGERLAANAISFRNSFASWKNRPLLRIYSQR